MLTCVQLFYFRHSKFALFHLSSNFTHLFTNANHTLRYHYLVNAHVYTYKKTTQTNLCLRSRLYCLLCLCCFHYRWTCSLLFSRRGTCHTPSAVAAARESVLSRTASIRSFVTRSNLRIRCCFCVATVKGVLLDTPAHACFDSFFGGIF